MAIKYAIKYKDTNLYLIDNLLGNRETNNIYETEIFDTLKEAKQNVKEQEKWFVDLYNSTKNFETKGLMDKNSLQNMKIVKVFTVSIREELKWAYLK